MRLNEQLLDDFINEIDMESWKYMAPSERLDFLQKFENTMAKMQGRDPLPVKLIPFHELEDASRQGGILRGYHDPQEDAIYLNPNFVLNRSNIVGITQFALPDALNTLAHEGRHAWQRYVVDHPEKNLVDRKTRLAFKMNFGKYFDADHHGYAIYAAQLIEMDARKYARKIVETIGEKMTSRDGKPDRFFLSSIRRSISEERALAVQLLREVSFEDLMKIEAQRIREMNASSMGVDYSGVSIFGDAIEFLKHKDLSKFVDSPPVGVKIEKYKEKVDIPDKFKDSQAISFREGKRRRMM